MEFLYTPTGVCSTQIRLEIDDQGFLRACNFDDGCDGNLSAVSRLVVGKQAQDVIAMLRGIDCRNGTSCPDQLARALEAYLAATNP